MMIDLEIVGEGATTKIYRDGDKAIKLYVDAPGNEAENEAKLQSYAVKMGLPVPPVYGVRKIDESMTALEMKYIPGKPLMHQGMSTDEHLAAIETLVKLQCDIHKITAAGIPCQSAKIMWRIEHNLFIDEDVKYKLFDHLKSLDTQSSRLCHGDFHPLNIMFDGDKYWIIDWVDATSGDPIADACRTYILFRQFLPYLAEKYIECFCKKSNVAQEKILAWLPIISAVRMVEKIDDNTLLSLKKDLVPMGLRV